MNELDSATTVRSPLADPLRFLKILDDPLYRLIVDLQDLVSVETTLFWSRRGLRTMHLPITTTSISSPMGLGSDSEPVQIELFGERTYLADSMQFMLEYGCRLTEAGCYYIMPSFRGEDADATHLNQFFHSEAEIHGGLEDVMLAVEDYLRHLAAAALSRHSGPIERAAGSVEHVRRLLDVPAVPRLTFDEAAARLGEDRSPMQAGAPWRVLTREGEQRLLREVSPVLWVTHYDHLAVPFYQAFADGTGRTALNADLLLGMGEVVGCGERHAAADALLDALSLHQVAPSQYAWYVEMKRTRPLRTAGFGLGIERFLAWLLGREDVRDIPLVQRLKGVPSQP
jgi:asparaginyl-tRNA synthetase